MPWVFIAKKRSADLNPAVAPMYFGPVRVAAQSWSSSFDPVLRSTKKVTSPVFGVKRAVSCLFGVERRRFLRLRGRMRPEQRAALRGAPLVLGVVSGARGCLSQHAPTVEKFRLRINDRTCEVAVFGVWPSS